MSEELTNLQHPTSHFGLLKMIETSQIKAGMLVKAPDNSLGLILKIDGSFSILVFWMLKNGREFTSWYEFYRTSIPWKIL